MKTLNDTPGSNTPLTGIEKHEAEVPVGLEQRLSALIDKLEAEEAATRQGQQKSSTRRSLWITGMAIAAVFAAAAFILLSPRKTGRAIEVDDPEEARVQTERALTALTTTFAKGVEGMEKAKHTTAHIIGALNN
ncbi:MAG: hypothetical protein IJ209_08635 [Bacteroidaceae bacterium]|nr:hypothetical protein [Bacteroidaceae bacterium]